MKRIWSGLKELEKGEESWYGGKEKAKHKIMLFMKNWQWHMKNHPETL